MAPKKPSIDDIVGGRQLVGGATVPAPIGGNQLNLPVSEAIAQDIAGGRVGVETPEVTLARQKAGNAFIRRKEKLASILGGGKNARDAAAQILTQEAERGTAAEGGKSEVLVTVKAAQAAQRAFNEATVQITGGEAPEGFLTDVAEQRPGTFGGELVGAGPAIGAAGTTAVIASGTSAITAAATATTATLGSVVSAGLAAVSILKLRSLATESGNQATASISQLDAILLAVASGDMEPGTATSLFTENENNIYRAERNLKVLNINSLATFLTGGKDSAIKAETARLALPGKRRALEEAIAQNIFTTRREEFINQNPAEALP